MYRFSISYSARSQTLGDNQGGLIVLSSGDHGIAIFQGQGMGFSQITDRPAPGLSQPYSMQVRGQERLMQSIFFLSQQLVKGGVDRYALQTRFCAGASPRLPCVLCLILFGIGFHTAAALLRVRFASGRRG
jgi:hypothetical protein